MTNSDKALGILMIVIPLSMLSGIIFPAVGQILSPYLLVLLGGLLFLNLLKLDARDLITTFTKPKMLLLLTILKLIILPLVMYSISYVVAPAMALPIVLLTGISTGLGSPFVVNFVGGRLPIIVGLIISTSIAVPFVLPTLVYVLFRTTFSIPILDMMLLLTSALFVPLALGLTIKRYSPKLASVAEKYSLSASIVLMALINFAMFANYSTYFITNQILVLEITLISFLLYGAYGLLGYLFVILASKKSATDERIAGFIAMTYINNILVVVFAQQFFGPEVAALSAFYNIPYHVGILILKKWSSSLVMTD
ncbi:MAG TPA: arsenic resistance protein [Nitrososphaeraceae archaeon]|nr:arsenic resistance protein [Nitrososphaeraceae archaeon]